MAWADLIEAGPSVTLLRRSLERGRLGHAYLFAGESMGILERVATELASTVNCQSPPESPPAGVPLAACGRCSSCRRIRQGLHPDVHWLKAESKLRVIRVEQVRVLIGELQLKPSEARFKIGILVGADRLHPSAASAFLKTLEEPPPRSLLILLSTEPDRLLETLRSRCLRLPFPGGPRFEEPQLAWLRSLTPEFRSSPESLLARYRLLDGLLRELASQRAAAEEAVGERSPASQLRDADPEWREQWEAEAKAAVEAEYRQRRGQTLQALHWWLRDVWLATLQEPGELLALPELSGETATVAARLAPERALANLQVLEETQTLLHTNVQEALALEVAMLRLDL